MQRDWTHWPREDAAVSTRSIPWRFELQALGSTACRRVVPRDPHEVVALIVMSCIESLEGSGLARLIQKTSHRGPQDLGKVYIHPCIHPNNPTDLSLRSGRLLSADSRSITT